MSDEADLASEVEQDRLNIAVQNIRNRVNTELESVEFCVDCDQEIPPLRRQQVKGCTRCTSCQSIVERRQKILYGKH